MFSVMFFFPNVKSITPLPTKGILFLRGESQLENIFLYICFPSSIHITAPVTPFISSSFITSKNSWQFGWNFPVFPLLPGIHIGVLQAVIVLF